LGKSVPNGAGSGQQPARIGLCRNCAKLTASIGSARANSATSSIVAWTRIGGSHDIAIDCAPIQYRDVSFVAAGPPTVFFTAYLHTGSSNHFDLAAGRRAI